MTEKPVIVEKMLSEVTPFNAGKKLPEIKALMSKMIPTAEKLRIYMHRAGAAQKELEAQIATLEKEVDSSKASVLERLELGQQLQKMQALEQTILDMQRTMDTIPPEIIASYNAPEFERKEPIAIE